MTRPYSRELSCFLDLPAGHVLIQGGRLQRNDRYAVRIAGEVIWREADVPFVGVKVSTFIAVARPQGGVR